MLPKSILASHAEPMPTASTTDIKAALISGPCFVAPLRVMRSVEIAFEAQMLHAAAMTPHKLEGLYPDLDVRFDVVRGHCAIRRFGLHALGDRWLIGHEEQRRLECCW